MIEMEMITAFSKPSDLKVCRECKKLNWYENFYCRDNDCTSERFFENIEDVEKAVKGKYTFYMEEEGMTEEEVDHIFIEV